MTAPLLDRPPVSTHSVSTRPGRRPETVARPIRPQLRVLRGDDVETEAERARLVRILAAVVVVAAALCLFGVVVFHVVLTQNQFRLDALQNDALDRQARYDRLRLEVAELESPDRIVADAQRLGLVTPGMITYLAPVVDGTPSRAGVAPDRRTEGPAGSAAGAGWSLVKPHLADG